jgi:predicted signal transduction protein with EAL and GGDEF domain
MLLFRWLLIVLMLVAGACFALFAITGQPRFKRYGLLILKWTLVSAFGFFAVLTLERLR